ncbi:MAG TPA: ferredoxin [Streptomyces sp.]|nr:ferredoxin [Streptomyces sp.]
MAGRRGDHVLVVDPINCTAHGLCADLLPEHIELDEWGYPRIDHRPVGPGLLAHARRAVATCPTLALNLQTQAQLKGPRSAT